ncbi:MAG TPA: DUF5329 family protein [Candidatus Binatia bacterium]|nr:DUF5329 family protein [Candidatus Binatia bacterium]
MTKTLKLILTYGFILALGLASLARAEFLPVSEKQKIEALIKQVSHLNEAQFVRNGSAYSADSAATFLRLKWQANASEVSTARDFINKIASFSGTSGKPYLIRFKDGAEIKSRDFLLAQLKKLET